MAIYPFQPGVLLYWLVTIGPAEQEDADSRAEDTRRKEISLVE